MRLFPAKQDVHEILSESIRIKFVFRFHFVGRQFWVWPNWGDISHLNGKRPCSRLRIVVRTQNQGQTQNRSVLAGRVCCLGHVCLAFLSVWGSLRFEMPASTRLTLYVADIRKNFIILYTDIRSGSSDRMKCVCESRLRSSNTCTAICWLHRSCNYLTTRGRQGKGCEAKCLWVGWFKQTCVLNNVCSGFLLFVRAFFKVFLWIQ